MAPASLVACGSATPSALTETSESLSTTLSSAAELTRKGQKGSKKLRTGCITCKIRRVKCDEAKPACVRCTRTGRKCDGYLPRAPGVSLRLQTLAPAPSRGVPSGPSSFAGWALTEHRAFDFYTACSSIRLFRLPTTNFWSRVVPSLCFQEPAIRHAVFAISDFHERSERSTKVFSPSQNAPLPELSAYAISHYNRAIQAMRNWKNSEVGALAGGSSIAVPLVACALFITIEFMCGNEEAGQMHISQGRRILASFDGNMTSPGTELIRRELVPVFRRLSVASFLFGAPPAPVAPELRWLPAYPPSDFSMVFNTVADAEAALDEIMEHGLRFWRSQIETRHATPRSDCQARALQTELLRRLREWREASNDLRSLKPLEIDGMTGKMHELYHLATRVFVQRALVTKDAHLEPASFASVAMEAKKIVDVYDQQRRMLQSACLAREDVLALRKQRATDCDENVWNAWRVAQIAQRAAAMEQQRANGAEPSRG